MLEQSNLIPRPERHISQELQRVDPLSSSVCAEQDIILFLDDDDDDPILPELSSLTLAALTLDSLNELTSDFSVFDSQLIHYGDHSVPEFGRWH